MKARERGDLEGGAERRYGDDDDTYYAHMPTAGLFLKHDPRSAFWDDFFLPKLLLLVVSFVSLFLVVMFRFSSNVKARTLYLTSSFVQLLLLSLYSWLGPTLLLTIPQPWPEH